jgi:hypothetical protein
MDAPRNANVGELWGMQVGDDIAKETAKDWKGLRVTVKLTVQNRQAKCSVVPSASALVIKALKEPVRDRKKVRRRVPRVGGGRGRVWRAQCNGIGTPDARPARLARRWGIKPWIRRRQPWIGAVDRRTDSACGRIQGVAGPWGFLHVFGGEWVAAWCRQGCRQGSPRSGFTGGRKFRTG